MALNSAMSKLTPTKQAAIYRRVLKLAGGRPRDLVAALGVFPQHVNHWKKRGFSPDACEKIEALYPGQISRHDLRPDLFGEKAA